MENKLAYEAIWGEDYPKKLIMMGRLKIFTKVALVLGALGIASMIMLFVFTAFLIPLPLIREFYLIFWILTVLILFIAFTLESKYEKPKKRINELKECLRLRELKKVRFRDKDLKHLKIFTYEGQKYIANIEKLKILEIKEDIYGKKEKEESS